MKKIVLFLSLFTVISCEKKEKVCSEKPLFSVDEVVSFKIKNEPALVLDTLRKSDDDWNLTCDYQYQIGYFENQVYTRIYVSENELVKK